MTMSDHLQKLAIGGLGLNTPVFLSSIFSVDGYDAARLYSPAQRFDCLQRPIPRFRLDISRSTDADRCSLLVELINARDAVTIILR